MLKVSCLLGMLAAAAVASPLAAQSSSDVPSPKLIEHPSWVRMPTGRDVAVNFPPEAKKRNISGSAVLSCTVTEGGLLADCQVLSESPPGLGFGDAALKMVPIFKMRPKSNDGEPTAGGTVQIPFQMMVW